jgi:pimeloyl-ACP methyl ester carboxylesterase
MPARYFALPANNSAGNVTVWVLMIRLLMLLFIVGGSVVRMFAADNLRLEDFAYPFPVKNFILSSQRQSLEMSYMDVAPRATAPGRDEVVVLLHGKNFSGAYWEETARALSDAGFRVIIPDQVGFGKSSKPENYSFSFHQLAWNTHELLRSLKIEQAHVVGHSMGGMVAARYALMFPTETRSLTLEDPLGLEDWKAAGVPYVSIDQSYESELAQTPEKIRAYQQKNYYGGQWRPAYDRWVEMLTLFARSSNYSRMAWDQALASEMIYTQPVLYEFGALKMPVLLVIGQRDRTAPGRDRAPTEVQETLGDYPALGRKTAAAIPHAKLVELEGVGHLPHIEAFPRFIQPLMDFLHSTN